MAGSGDTDDLEDGTRADSPRSHRVAIGAVLVAVGLVAIALTGHGLDRADPPRPTGRAARATAATTTTEPWVVPSGGGPEGTAAIRGRTSGPLVPITAVRTDRTADDLVIEFTDVAPERSVLGFVMEAAPPAPDTVVGVCTHGYRVTVDRSGPTPSVAIGAVVDSSRRTIAQRQGHHCIDTGGGSLLRVHLPHPITTAMILDASTGTSVPLFDGSTLLRPTVLPASVVWDLQWAEAGGWGFGYSDGFHAPPGIGITILQGYGGNPARAAGLLPVRSVTVGGHPAELLATGAIRGLRWTNGSSTVLVMLQPVSPTGPDDALDPVLFEFANGLR